MKWEKVNSTFLTSLHLILRWLECIDNEDQSVYPLFYFSYRSNQLSKTNNTTCCAIPWVRLLQFDFLYGKKKSFYNRSSNPFEYHQVSVWKVTITRKHDDWYEECDDVIKRRTLKLEKKGCTPIENSLPGVVTQMPIIFLLVLMPNVKYLL